MTEETWVEIRPGLEVSSEGRVRQYLNGHLDRDGYRTISGGARGASRMKVHHLVAEAFLGPRPAGAVVRHRNDLKLDNRAENLVYGTRRDNWHDGERNGIFNRYDPARIANLRRASAAGGKWWAGRKRDGIRGKAVRS